jgi:hypothetical protein
MIIYIGHKQMIKVPDNKLRQKYGATYNLQLKHIINIKLKYNITLDRTSINKQYNIKQYNIRPLQ